MLAMKAPIPLCLVVSVSVLVGCNSTKKSYQVEVNNQTNAPVTLWLCKDGPPKEEGWLSPEELIDAHSERDLNYDFQVVDPAKTAYTDSLSGEFPKGTNAVLRVYPGTPNYFDMAKIGPGVRVEHTLKPGNNRMILTENAGQLVLHPK